MTPATSSGPKCLIHSEANQAGLQKTKTEAGKDDWIRRRRINLDYLNPSCIPDLVDEASEACASSARMASWHHRDRIRLGAVTSLLDLPLDRRILMPTLRIPSFTGRHAIGRRRDFKEKKKRS